jgi:hypothetical protein
MGGGKKRNHEKKKNEKCVYTSQEQRTIHSRCMAYIKTIFIYLYIYIYVYLPGAEGNP